MTRTTLILAISYLLFSCNQNPKTMVNKEPTLPKDSLQKEKSLITGNTEIDFVKSSPDKTKILLENEYVRVIEYTLKPGERDSTHTHPPKASYVISGGTLKIYPENEKPFVSEEVKGNAEWSGRRGKHFVKNIGNTTVKILLTEVKSAR